MKQNVLVDEAAVEYLQNDHSDEGNTPEMLEWLKDAGFGLFIHWSLDVQLGCVISHTLVGASQDYTQRFFEDLPRTFMPDRWSAERVARLAKTAGAKYVVFTTKHHNGFCMWDTKTTDFSIMNTPYGKDIVTQVVDAFRTQGLKVGFYYSPEDFRFLYMNGQTITRNPEVPYTPEVLGKYREYLAAQMKELMSNYGKIDLIFFDGGELMKDEHGESLQAMCKRMAWELQPGILVTRGAIKTPEQQLPGVGMEETWEGCLTMSTAWGYQPTNDTYKTGKHLIEILTNTRSLGGTLLLNIGPDSDGEIGGPQEGLLREVGLWNFVNGEAIYGVRPWVISKEGDITLLTDKSKSTVYAVLNGQGEEWERGQRREFLLKSVQATVESEISILGASGELTEYRPDLDAKSVLEQTDAGLRFSVMNAQRIYCGMNWSNPLVVKITKIKKTFDPMHIRTANESLDQLTEGVNVSAEVLNLGSFDHADVFFQWRKFPGFANAVYDAGWMETSSVKVDALGRVTILLEGLEPYITYQYRAVIENESNKLLGEIYRFTKES